MASVILFDATRMQAIEDGTIVSGLVDINGHLILSRHDGGTSDAGQVKGTKGDTGTPGAQGIPGVKGDTGNTGPQGVKGDTGLTPIGYGTSLSTITIPDVNNSPGTVSLSFQTQAGRQFNLGDWAKVTATDDLDVFFVGVVVNYSGTNMTVAAYISSEPYHQVGSDQFAAVTKSSWTVALTGSPQLKNTRQVDDTNHGVTSVPAIGATVFFTWGSDNENVQFDGSYLYAIDANNEQNWITFTTNGGDYYSALGTVVNSHGSGPVSQWYLQGGGAPGKDGPQGIQGIQGIQGVKGDTGNTGAASTVAGPTGPAPVVGASITAVTAALVATASTPPAVGANGTVTTNVPMTGVTANSRVLLSWSSNANTNWAIMQVTSISGNNIVGTLESVSSTWTSGGGGTTWGNAALTGIRGPQGPQGTAGTNGSNGTNGATGPAGPAFSTPASTTVQGIAALATAAEALAASEATKIITAATLDAALKDADRGTVKTVITSQTTFNVLFPTGAADEYEVAWKLVGDSGSFTLTTRLSKAGTAITTAQYFANQSAAGATATSVNEQVAVTTWAWSVGATARTRQWGRVRFMEFTSGSLVYFNGEMGSVNAATAPIIAAFSGLFNAAPAVGAPDGLTFIASAPVSGYVTVKKIRYN